MAKYIEHIMERDREWRKAEESSSQLIKNALEAVDGAIWLVAGRRYALAVTSLHNSVELIFKAELEKIHRILIADNRRLDYKTLKRLLRDAFKQHPQGADMDIEEFDIDRTITFADSFDRVMDLYPRLNDWKTEIKRLQAVRNDIVHYGGDLSKREEYEYLIAAVAIPLLSEFLSDSSDIDLSAFLGRDVSRELDVAKKVCRLRGNVGRSVEIDALKTVRAVVLFREVDFPEPTDSDGWIQGADEREAEAASSLRAELRKEFKGNLIESSCRICGSAYCLVGFVDAEETEGDDSWPVVVACPGCGLSLSRDESLLVREHYGPLDE
ncbi:MULTISPECIES: hypothetical protein [unclassified Thioalkalivibrio]|uniref:hypothetical protein n=1 Tax=unclassified Thioalkalivibrio TaxID=2621013 RepID=UPI0012DC41F2|nr:MULTISPECIES: hypothetical protein [unclassified Thioalkalivibrio]